MGQHMRFWDLLHMHSQSLITYVELHSGASRLEVNLFD